MSFFLDQYVCQWITGDKVCFKSPAKKHEDGQFYCVEHMDKPAPDAFVNAMALEFGRSMEQSFRDEVWGGE